jgi:hypothetical protein
VTDSDWAVLSYVETQFLFLDAVRWPVLPDELKYTALIITKF